MIQFLIKFLEIVSPLSINLFIPKTSTIYLVTAQSAGATVVNNTSKSLLIEAGNKQIEICLYTMPYYNK